jgi:hypothetical protein
MVLGPPCVAIDVGLLLVVAEEVVLVVGCLVVGCWLWLELEEMMGARRPQKPYGTYLLY